MVFKFPISIIQRQLYIIIACYFYPHTYISLQLFILMNLFYTMYCVSFKPNAPKYQRIQQLITEVSLHMIMLLLFLFTDFVILTETHLFYSYVYMGLFGAIILVNMIMIIYSSILLFLTNRRFEKIKMNKLQNFKK